MAVANNPIDYEICLKVDNKLNVKYYSKDSRKNKYQFEIKSETDSYMTRTVETDPDNKDIEDNKDKHVNSEDDDQNLWSQQKYSKDSFDRFGDDLSEVILGFLPLKKKFEFQCVNTVWKTIIFKRQSRINITNFTDDYDSIKQLIPDEYDRQRQRSPNKYRWEAVLNKCRYINTIYVNFRYEIDFENEPIVDYILKNSFFEILNKSSIPLKKLTICAEVEESVKYIIKMFAQKFGKQLTEIRFKRVSDVVLEPFFDAKVFPNLRKLDINSINNDLSKDFFKYFHDNKMFPKLKHLKHTFCGLDGFQVISQMNLWHLTTVDVVFDTELCSELEENGVNEALKRLSAIEAMDVFNIKIFTEDTTVNAIDTGLQMIARNCKHLKRLDFIMDTIVLKNRLFDVFSSFQSLEYCEISVEYSTDMKDYGSLQSFSHCKSLRVLNLYLFNLCDQHLRDIDRYIPQLTNLHIKSKKGITDLTLDYLKNCRQLEVLELHTYTDPFVRMDITDSAIARVIKGSKLRVLLIYSRQKEVCLDQSIRLMLERAESKPKVKHTLGAYGMVGILKRFAESHNQNRYKSRPNSTKTMKTKSITLPANLAIYGLPHSGDKTKIESFEYFSGHAVPKSGPTPLWSKRQFYDDH